MSPTWTAAASPLRRPAKAQSARYARKPFRVETRVLSACCSRPPTSSTDGIRMAASALRRRGSATPMLGSVAMTRSATAARKMDRTITKRVLIVVGAKWVDIAFTHASTCERLIDFIGKSAKLTEPVARSALALVEGTQSCRGAHSS